jgi:hypothetical protein
MECYHQCMLPAAFAEIDSELADTARFARMSPEERLALFVQLCDLTDSVQAGRPDPASLRAPTPISIEAAALWTKLMRRENG